MKKITLLLFSFLVASFSAFAQDSCANAVVLTPGTQQCGNTSEGADIYGNSPCLGSYDGGDDYMFTYTASATGETVTLTLSGQSSWTGFAMSDGCPDGSVSCLGSSTSSSSASQTFTTDPLVAGVQYYIQISTYPSPQSTAFCLDAVVTAPPTCPDPSSLLVSNITSTSADLAWTAGDAETLWNIEIVDITAGGTVTGNATDTGVPNPFTKSGLTDITTYNYYVQADCGGGDTSSWVGPFEFTTFGGCSSSGSFTYQNNSDVSNSLNSFIADTPGDYITLTFTAGSTEVGYDDWFILDSADETGNVIATGDGSIVGSYESTTGEISFYVDSDFGTTGSTFQYSSSCAAPPTCLSPSALSASNITDTTADLSWTLGDTETLWNIEIVDITAGGTATGTPTDTGVTNPFSASGLTSNNDYEFYVQADCGGGDISDWEGPFAFTTSCAVFTAPYTQDFENDGNIPDCWTNTGDDTWEFRLSGPNYVGNAGTITGSTASGSYYAVLDDSDPSSTNGAIVSPFVDVTGLTTPALYFYEISTVSTSQTNATLTVEVYDGSSWNTVGTYNTNTDGWEEKIIDLSGLTFTGPAQARFAVTDSGSFYDDIAIDDVSFKEAPTCYAPLALTASSITAFTAELGWTETGSASLYDVEIVDITAGNLATGTPSFASVSNPYTAMSLAADNDYEFYVRADCGTTDGVSTWKGPFAFSTLIACQAPTSLTATSITASSATLGWTENGTATLYNIEIVDLTAGGTVTGNATVTGVANPYTVTNLASSNDYAFYVQADCGTTNGVSTWSGPRSFTTECAEISSFPSLTDFTNNPPTACWSEAGSGEVADGPSSLGFSDWKSGRAYTNSNAEVVNSNVINLWDNDDREWLLSPSYNIPVGIPHSLVVEVAVTDYTSSGTSTATATDTMGSDDEVQLLVTTDNGVTWTNLTTWNVGNQPAVTGTEYIADLTPYSGSMRFAIWASDGTTNNSEDYDFHIGMFSVINNNTLSVDEVELSNFKYFPNPVNDNLSLRAQQYIQNVSVFNMLGQEVLRVAPNALNSEVNMSEFNSGAYFVKVTIDNVTETIKVIKK